MHTGHGQQVFLENRYLTSFLSKIYSVHSYIQENPFSNNIETLFGEFFSSLILHWLMIDFEMTSYTIILS